MNRYRWISSAAALLLGAVCVLCSGCVSIFPASTILWWKKEKPSSRPTSVVEFWKEDVLEFAGVPTRGFGGRLMFYDQNASAELRERPVKIDGRLTIYAFDDSDYEQGSTAAEKKFVFEPDQVEKAYSEAAIMGHSYSFWLPWDTDIDGSRQKICLIAVLENREGAPVLRSGETHRVVLPGKSDKDSKSSGVASGAVRRARIIEDSSDRPANRVAGIRDEWSGGGQDSGSRKARRTETIPLTRSGTFAQPGPSAIEQPVREFELPKLHQRKTRSETAADAEKDTDAPASGAEPGTAAKSGGAGGKTSTVLVGPLNDDPKAIDDLSSVLGKRTAYPIGRGPAT